MSCTISFIGITRKQCLFPLLYSTSSDVGGAEAEGSGLIEVEPQHGQVDVPGTGNEIVHSPEEDKPIGRDGGDREGDDDDDEAEEEDDDASDDEDEEVEGEEEEDGLHRAPRFSDETGTEIHLLKPPSPAVVGGVSIAVSHPRMSWTQEEDDLLQEGDSFVCIYVCMPHSLLFSSLDG